MLGRLNHVALAVPDLEQASRFYRDALGANVSVTQDLPDHGVRVAFVDMGNCKVELMEPLGENSPIAAFIKRNPGGGTHHVCYEVADIAMARQAAAQHGFRIIGSGEPKIGAHGKPVLFLHPKDTFGTMIELEQA